MPITHRRQPSFASKRLWLRAFHAVVPSLIGAFRPQILVTQCGVDTHAEDPLRPLRLASEKSQMLLELEARCLLLGPVQLEYVGAAIPALDPLERNRIDQDLRFAVPLGQAGQLRLGAKCTWQDLTAPKSWNDGMQLYLGVGLRR